MYDLKNWDPETSDEPPFRRFTNSISLREHVLDVWASSERLLRAVFAVLDSSSPREVAWKAARSMRTRDLIDSVFERLQAADNAPADTFPSALWDLYSLRNLLAHNDSRPMPLAPTSGVRVLQTLQFNKGVYTDVSNEQMNTATTRAAEMMTWLAGIYPEADGVSFELDDDEAARLLAEFPEEP